MALKQLRLQYKQTLDEVALAAGTTRGHIWAIERGRIKDPGVTILTAIADHYHCTLDTVVGRISPADDEKLDTMERVLVSMFNELEADKREMLLAIARAFRCKETDKAA